MRENVRDRDRLEHIVEAICALHAETPWEFIAKMRHVLVHDYYQINPSEVWTVHRIC